MHASFTRFSIAVALATGIPLLAQTPSPSTGQPPTQKPTSPATAQAGETMLTGCLRSSHADQGAADSKGVVFTLEVTEATGTRPAPSLEAGAPPPPAAASKTTYTLNGPESLGLAKHVNHEVQLTGRMQASSATMRSTERPQSTPPATQTPSPTTGGAKPVAGGGGGHRTFEVAALKMVSANCSQP